MTDRKIQQIWQNSYEAFLSSGYFLSDAQKKASYAIMNRSFLSVSREDLLKRRTQLPTPKQSLRMQKA